jgi:hypothetical protein
MIPLALATMSPGHLLVLGASVGAMATACAFIALHAYHVVRDN